MILTSQRHQRVLAVMCGALRRTDPRLVARFTVFTQLPATKRFRASSRYGPLRCTGWWLSCAGGRPPCARLTASAAGRA